MTAPIDINDPRPGFYQMRERKGGRLVGVRIWIEPGERDEAGDLLEDEPILCQVNGVEADPWQVWPWCAKPEQEIDEAGYRYRLAATEWDERHGGIEPGKTIDLNSTRPVF